MKRSTLDGLIFGLLVSLCALTTGAGYLAAKARNDSQREEYLNAAAQGIFESISTQLLRTSESLRIAAVMLSEDHAPSPNGLGLLTFTIPHLVGSERPVQWFSENVLDRPVAQNQKMLGRVHIDTESPAGSYFDLLTPVGSKLEEPRNSSKSTLHGALSTRISVASMLSEAAYRSEAQQFEIEVFDRHESPPLSIFRSTPFSHVADERLSIHSSLDVFGHPWEVVLRPMEAESVWWTPPHLVLASGIVLSLLLLTLLTKLRKSRMRMEAAEEKEREERSKREQEELIRQLSDRIARLDRSQGVGEMAFIIGHELSQPLTAINSLAELGTTLADAQGEQSKPFRDIFQKISRNAARGSALLDQIRNYVRGTTAKNVRVDICKALSEVTDLLEAEAQRCQVTLNLALDSGSDAVIGDPLQLSQVFVNVIRNAIEASSHAPRSDVLIRMTHDGMLIHVMVRDHGEGFSAEALQQAGTPFFTTKKSGLGLGLTISSNIIKAHGGTLQLSNAPEGGAQVVIKIPATN